MAYEVLARKWRPQTFETVIGQEHITSTLVNAIGSGRLSHAYLFSGPRGVGKTSVARILAKAINCVSGEKEVPCNRCASCTEITGGSSVDVQEIDGASNRGIDEIRDLREGIKYLPSSSTYRVYIIDEVHMLTLPAFNALLKTLEEPPPHVKFIFATTEAQKVPVTILSRCQRFDFKRIPLNLIAGHLRSVADKEGVEISDSALFAIAGESEGSMRDAESLLDQVVSSVGTRVEDSRLSDILGVVDRNVISRAALAVLESSAVRCLDLIEDIYVRGYDIKDIYRLLMDHFRSLFVYSIAPEALSGGMPVDERDEIARQAALASPDKLQVLLDFLISREETIRFTSSPRVILESTMIRMCRIDDFLSLEEILEKLDALGRGNAYEPALSPPVEQDGATAGAQPAGDGPGWPEFLGFLKARNKAMHNVLKDWEARRFEGDNLEIIKGGRPFSASYLDDSANMAHLENLCRAFFGRPITIKILPAKKNVSSPAGREGGEREAARTVSQDSTATDRGDPVGEVLRIFHGQVSSEFRPVRSNENFPGPAPDSPDKEEG